MKKAVFKLPTGELKYFDLDFLLKEGKSLTLQEREIGGKLSHFSGDSLSETDKCIHEGCKQKKPPLGVVPREIHESLRFQELDRAMNDYILENKIIPAEWSIEWNDLYIRLNRKSKL